MAKLYSTHNAIEAPTTTTYTYATFASLGVMCCMVVTLIGIKLWWFKHRLSFDQSSTSNGAAGGAQPRVVTRSRSSKDKRLSQQIREPVVVHGIFRKREEDEMEVFERPKQLPPVRPGKLSESKSLSSLFRPPSALREGVDIEALTIPAPPTYEPPTPPQYELPTPPAIQERPTPPATLAIPKPQTLQIAVPITITTPDIQAVPTPVETATFKEESSQNWASFGEHQTLKQQQQQMAVTPISDNEEHIKEITAAITIHQTQTPTEQAPRALERNFSDRSENEEVAPRLFRKAKPAFEPFKSGPNISERRITGFQKPEQDVWQQKENERKGITYDEVWAKNSNEQYYEDEFGKMELKPKTVQFKVNEQIDQVDYEIEKDSMIKERRPTGYVRNAKELNNDTTLDGEKIDDSNQYEHNLWQEMEKDIEGDFTVNIEEEFNKIRHTYEANEDGFLESPTGYGKSIDEDWENFESLKTIKASNVKHELLQGNQEIRPSSYIKEWLAETNLENETYKEEQKAVTFSVEEDVAKGKSKSTFIAPRRATGFVRDKVEFDKELWADEETTTNKKSILKSDYIDNNGDDDDNDDDYNQYEEDNNQIISLTERRPTGYVRDAESLELSGSNARESIIEVEHEPLRIAKPRQKVTFQVHTKSYSPPHTPSYGLESDVETEEERLNQELPKPMQRMTKTRYTVDTEITIEPTPPPRLTNTAALLFSTQVSAEYAATSEDEFGSSGGDGGNDSWSAIRKHRNLTEEFQQITLAEDTETVLPRPAPKAAYRNPLAQMALTTSTDVTTPEDVEEYVKPRTMRDMKKAQSRRVESLQFETHAGTAEA